MCVMLSPAREHYMWITEACPTKLLGAVESAVDIVSPCKKLKLSQDTEPKQPLSVFINDNKATAVQEIAADLALEQERRSLPSVPNV